MAVQRIPTLEDVARICRAHAIDPGVIQPVNEGGDNRTFAIDDRFICRFAITPDLTERQRIELIARRQLAHQRCIPLAAIEGHGHWHEHLGYILEQRIPGSSLEHTKLSQTGERQLAAALTALRGMPMERAIPATPDPDLERFLGRAHEAIAIVPEAGLTIADLDSLPVPPRSAPHCWIHNDLKGEHIYVDDSGALAGIIDWTDIAIGDPAWDTGGLAISMHVDRAIVVAREAGYPEDAIERGVTIARLHTLHGLARHRRGGYDAPLDLLWKQFLRAWGRSS